MRISDWSSDVCSSDLHDVFFAVELADFFAVGHNGTHAGTREEGRNAGAAGAKFLGQRTLRREFKLEIASQELALELFVFAHIRGDHFLEQREIGIASCRESLCKSV